MEDCFVEAFELGVRQYVVLGAGLDTFAYRTQFKGVHVYEVDHPATQDWKRECLAEAAITLPEYVAFAPVDFELETILDGLLRVQFDSSQPAFYAWLGVTPYLEHDAIERTLGLIANQNDSRYRDSVRFRRLSQCPFSRAAPAGAC